MEKIVVLLAASGLGDELKADLRTAWANGDASAVDQIDSFCLVTANGEDCTSVSKSESGGNLVVTGTLTIQNATGTASTWKLKAGSKLYFSGDASTGWDTGDGTSPSLSAGDVVDFTVTIDTGDWGAQGRKFARHQTGHSVVLWPTELYAIDSNGSIVFTFGNIARNVDASKVAHVTGNWKNDTGTTKSANAIRVSFSDADGTENDEISKSILVEDGYRVSVDVSYDLA